MTFFFRVPKVTATRRHVIMLKWLQSGVYHHSGNVHLQNVTDIITDDPLATLNFKEEEEENASKSAGIMAFKGQIIHKEIYSVSR